MANGITRVVDVIVPEIFSPYVQQLTEEKSRLIQSGAVLRDFRLDSVLAGGGLTFNEPSFRDLDNDEDNVSSDDPAVDSTPEKIGTSNEVQVRLSRNNSWSSMDLTGDLAGADPMNAVANTVAGYWARRDQAAFVATMKGVFANNAAAPIGTEHIQNDMTFDISGASFVDGVTTFSAEAFIDAATTMGDSMEALSVVFMHSIVYAKALKNNLIQFLPPSANNLGYRIPTFLNRQVVVDDSLPFAGGIAETWIFGSNSIRMGVGMPKVPTEIDRDAAAGNGGGMETLYNRRELIIHPVGYAYAGTPPVGGPSNAATANNLANATSWIRVYPERKQIHIARLITRES
jgi:hypothetical protein